MTKLDGRIVRGAVRRAAYADAAQQLKLSTLRVPEVASSDELASLYFAERNRLLEWLDERGRGVLALPPGGVVHRPAKKRRAA